MNDYIWFKYEKKKRIKGKAGKCEKNQIHGNNFRRFSQKQRKIKQKIKQYKPLEVLIIRVIGYNLVYIYKQSC